MLTKYLCLTITQRTSVDISTILNNLKKKYNYVSQLPLNQINQILFLSYYGMYTYNELDNECNVIKHNVI